MSYHQYKLFDYTRASELLTGEDVIKATHVKRIIKILQSQSKVEKNWKLDIYCRDPASIINISITRIEPTSAAYPYGRYGIAITKSISFSDYHLCIAWFGSKQEGIEMLTTVREYIVYRYGVSFI